MNVLRPLVLFIFFIIFVCNAQADNIDEKSKIEYEKWRTGFVHEVSSVENPLDEFNSIFEELCSNKSFTFVERYKKCRKLIRLAYTEDVHNKINYPQVLRVLGNHFWRNYNDTILAVTLQLESNRLSIEDNLSIDNIGEIHSMASQSLFAKFKNDREAALNTFWPSAYLFGCHGTATRMLCDLAASYYDQNDYLAADYYQQWAEKWNNAYVNDANTNFAIYINRKLDIYNELRERNLTYQQHVFQSDLTALAQQIRKHFIPVMEATEPGDIVSAYFFREIGIDFMNKHEYSYATRYFARSANDFKRLDLSKTDILFCANSYYHLGSSLRMLGDFQNAKHAFSNALKCLEGYDELTMTGLFVKIMLAQTMLEADEEYSALKIISEMQDYLLNEDDTFYIDFLPNIGYDFKTKQQAILVPFFMFFHVKGLSQISENDMEALNCFLGVQNIFEKHQMQNSYLYYNNKVYLAQQYISLNELDKAKKELNYCISAYKSKKRIE